jgi:hypothetical protein
MTEELDRTVAVLTRTPAVMATLLRDLPEFWTQQNEGEGTWSAYDVIGHLCHGERTDWVPRIKRILESGESRAFEPFDRFAQRRESQGKSLHQLLDEFARLRSANLAELRALGLNADDLRNRGLHPSLGTVTLLQLLAAWAAHDLTHLHQVSRIMAHQYRDAVGPWTEYMGVLKCAGHSGS